MDNLEEEEKKKKRNILRKKRWYQNWLFEKLGLENVDPDHQETLLDNTPLAEQLETIEFVQQNKIHSDHCLLTDNITPLEERERIERAEEEKLKKYYTKLGYKNVKVKGSKWSNLSESTKKAWANKTEKQRTKHARNIAKGLKKRNKQKRAKKQ